MLAKNVGVLALQGAFSKHIEMLVSLEVNAFEVKYPSQLDICDSLIIPGGESTAIMKHLKNNFFIEPLLSFAKSNPVFGTCAGLILLSKEIAHDPMSPLGILDITVERNAFGRQIESFKTNLELSLGKKKCNDFPAFFIRAPRIKSIGENVKVLASYQNEPVLVQQGHILGASFHPELTNDERIHEYFLRI